MSAARAPAPPRRTLEPVRVLVQLHDLDLLLAECDDAGARVQRRKLGLELAGPDRARATREKLAQQLEPRWLTVYERVRGRYGRAMVAVRERVCTGCHVTMPITARPRGASDDPPSLCQGCGRLLYWG